MTNPEPSPSSPSSVTPIHQRSWATEAGDYSPDRFYVTSTDAQGRGSQRRAQFPDDLLGEVERIVQSGKLPDWTTFQDVMRDALFHRLWHVRGMVDSARLDRMLEIYKSQAEMDRHIHAAEAEQGFYDRTMTGFALAAHDPERLRGVVETAEDAIRRGRLGLKTREMLERELEHWRRVVDGE